MIFKVLDLMLASYFVVGILLIKISFSSDTLFATGLRICGIFLIAVPVIIFGFYYFGLKKRVHKPTDLEWDNLQKNKCCHITYKKHLNKIDKGNSNVYIKTTKSFISNAAILCRPSVYFFIGEPNIEQLKRNDINSDRKYIIYVDIKDLDRNRVRIRQYDNVLVYIGSYNRKGKLKEYTQYYDSQYNKERKDI